MSSPWRSTSLDALPKSDQCSEGLIGETSSNKRSLPIQAPGAGARSNFFGDVPEVQLTDRARQLEGGDFSDQRMNFDSAKSNTMRDRRRRSSCNAGEWVDE